MSEEPAARGSTEWYGWFLSDEQRAARRAKEEAEVAEAEARDAAPIAFGALRDALKAAVHDLEIDMDTDDRITLAANGAAVRALEKIMESLGMDRWS